VLISRIPWSESGLRVGAGVEEVAEGEPSKLRTAIPASAPSRDPASDLDPFVIKMLESILGRNLKDLFRKILLNLVQKTKFIHRLR